MRSARPGSPTRPWIVLFFRHAFGLGADGDRRTYYYTQESCGIAAALRRTVAADLAKAARPSSRARDPGLDSTRRYSA